MGKEKMQAVVAGLAMDIKGHTRDGARFNNYSVYMNTRGDRFLEADDGSFHMVFSKLSGFTAKWGRTFDDDPPFNPFGNEIADIEITRACRGIRDKDGVRHPCPFCYKANTEHGKYMSLATFINIFNKLDAAKTMTQIAFGVDAEASEELNPDIWKIFAYTADHGVTPNVTVADISDETAKKIVQYCGATAVSAYPVNKDRCYDSVQKLLAEAKRQGRIGYKVNIHAMVSEETYDFLFELLEDVQHDKRLEGLNAVVFLSLKQKGRGTAFHRIDDDKFKRLVDYCFEHHVRFGMDSCSANKFLRSIKDSPNFEEMSMYVEPCEKLLYSLYINVDGRLFPCSFMEHEGNWVEGIDMLKIKDFYREVWMSPLAARDREVSMRCIECNGCNSCHYYDI